MLTVLCIVVLAVSLFLLARELILLPKQAQETAQEASGIYHAVSVPSPSGEKGESGREDSVNPNFAALKEINPDIVGWITLPNTVIDYPVLQSGTDDPEFYLTHNYKKESTKYGSIFVDSKANLDTTRNLVLYGHNMRDGQMFASILNYVNLDFYKASPVIQFDVEGRETFWKIISIYKTNVLESQGQVFNFVQSSFSNEETFLDFADQVLARSYLDIPVDVQAGDQLLTLSTCSSEYKDFRTVLVTRRVRDGEDPSVEVESAQRNPSPVLPECWKKVVPS